MQTPSAIFNRLAIAAGLLLDASAMAQAGKK